jgi:hypothetical protein
MRDLRRSRFVSVDTHDSETGCSRCGLVFAAGNPTIADAILDRLVHNAHRLTLKGDSMRKIAAKRSGLDASPAL